jgi:hypothetical protein
LVSVGMSLVFNAHFYFSLIDRIHGGPIRSNQAKLVASRVTLLRNSEAGVLDLLVSPPDRHIRPGIGKRIGEGPNAIKAHS